MTTNPLRRDGLAMVNTGRGARPGEIVTILVRDDKGREIADPIVFMRTDREYVHDLCDAYNARRRNEHAPFWYVDHAGNIKPGDQPRARAEEWKPEPGEIEATHQVVQRAINVGLPTEEWMRLVRNGSITREVQRVMREMDQEQAA
jgi:hypothetical protein